ncbi:MAG TPA: hypothetical protein PL183_06655 [Aquamicrobium sp.]|jgi:hypothetical protein|nr:hypothetical protein [Aquamicrobium sp.]
MNNPHVRMAIFLAIPVIALAYFSGRPEIDMSTTAAIVAPAGGEDGFRLVATGDRDSDPGRLDCSLAAGEAPEGAPRPLRMAPGCMPANPHLAGARWWLDRPDGTVALAAADGRILAEFAAGDGAAFESYAPRYPLMTLLADD